MMLINVSWRFFFRCGLLSRISRPPICGMHGWGLVSNENIMGSMININIAYSTQNTAMSRANKFCEGFGCFGNGFLSGCVCA